MVFNDIYAVWSYDLNANFLIHLLQQSQPTLGPANVTSTHILHNIELIGSWMLERSSKAPLLCRLRMQITTCTKSQVCLKVVRDYCLELQRKDLIFLLGWYGSGWSYFSSGQPFTDPWTKLAGSFISWKRVTSSEYNILFLKQAALTIHNPSNSILL